MRHVDAAALSAQQFQILLALTDEDRHGYGIIGEVATRTGGTVRLGTGALYTALGRLAASGLVRETDRQDADDPRRRFYTLTRLGKARLAAETARLEALVAQARQKGVRGAPARSRP